MVQLLAVGAGAVTGLLVHHDIKVSGLQLVARAHLVLTERGEELRCPTGAGGGGGSAAIIAGDMHSYSTVRYL